MTHHGLMIPASQSHIRGLWTVEARAPLEVSDPEKARALMGLPARPRTAAGIQRMAKAIIPVAHAERFLRSCDRLTRREFERLLSGGDRLAITTFENLVVNEGLDDLLDVTLSGATQDTTWFVGLTDGTPTPAAGDTLASHAGWVEVTAYDEAARVAWTDGGVSGQSVSNSASQAAFSVNADSTTIGGAFLAGDNTKGGTTGSLYAVGAFSQGDFILGSGSTLNVTTTFTMASA